RRLELRMLRHERRQLVLERVVVGVRQHAVAAAVVSVVEPPDLGGQLLDPCANIHPMILPLRSAIIGTGFVGAIHARSARLAGGVIAGVAASTPDGGREAAAKLGAERAYDGAEELATADGIDVVHICTPNHLHAPLARAALEAGKHVICEKPLAMTAEEAATLT